MTMFEWLRPHVLRLMRVPPAPTPPLGAPDSIRFFRAGQNYYKLKLIGWGFTQLGALAGLGFAIFISYLAVNGIKTGQAALLTPPPPPAAAATAVTPPKAETASTDKPRKRSNRKDLMKSMGSQTATVLIIVIEIAETFAVLFFFAQAFVTFAITRLDFELHWYIVTDRSLRIRTGVLRLQETTMSFANLQQVTVTQGPLQRYLGLADVRVESAGGGGSDQHKPGADASLHSGVFHGVDNAHEIRDLILARLRQFRATGLGDPDETPALVRGVHPPRPDSAPAADTLAAARELLREATALRQKITGSA
jgi:membrane protein YdbS with pleckstrin-like domain